MMKLSQPRQRHSLSGPTVLQTSDDLPRDITGPETLAPSAPPPLAETGWAILVVLIVVAAVLVVWAIRRFGRRRPPPAVRALAQLDRLARLRLVANDQAEWHFTLLSNIARRYIETSAGIPASRRTTAEFLALAESHPGLEAHRAFLHTFLTACDRAKFAPRGAVAVDDLSAELRRWIESTSPGSPTR